MKFVIEPERQKEVKVSLRTDTTKNGVNICLNGIIVAYFDNSDGKLGLNPLEDFEEDELESCGIPVENSYIVMYSGI